MRNFTIKYEDFKMQISMYKVVQELKPSYTKI